MLTGYYLYLSVYSHNRTHFEAYDALSLVWLSAWLFGLAVSLKVINGVLKSLHGLRLDTTFSLDGTRGIPCLEFNTCRNHFAGQRAGPYEKHLVWTA